MDLMETIPIIVSSILSKAVADCAVNVSPLGQTSIDVVFIREHLGIRGYSCSNDGLNSDLSDVFKHSDHDLTRVLNDTQDWRFFLLQGATTSGAFQAVSSALAPFIFDNFRMTFMACYTEK